MQGGILFKKKTTKQTNGKPEATAALQMQLKLAFLPRSFCVSGAVKVIQAFALHAK